MKKCQFCAEEVQDEAIVCKHCGKELNKQAVKKKEYNWTFRKISCAVILVPVVLIFVITMAGGCNNSKSTPTDSALSNVGVGQEGFLRTSDTGADVLLATSEKSFDDLINASVAKDTIGMAQIVLNGNAFYIPYNTKVLVIESSFAKRKVRILEGEKVGETGWIPYEFVVAK
ncbi:MAG: hypothetical protein WA057_02300 [Candidatus Magasanikiibacteriota bacterium]